MATRTYSPRLRSTIADKFDTFDEMTVTVRQAIAHVVEENWPTWPDSHTGPDAVDAVELDELALIVCSVLHLHPQTYLGVVRDHVHNLGQ